MLVVMNQKATQKEIDFVVSVRKILNLLNISEVNFRFSSTPHQS